MISPCMNPIHDLIFDRIEHLVSRAVHLNEVGDLPTALFLLAKAEDLALSTDGGDTTFVMTYHRYLSDSFGVVFELAHGDPELTFGGVV